MNFFQTIPPVLQSGSFCIALEKGVFGHLAQDQFIFDNRAPENVKTGEVFQFIRHSEMAKMLLNLKFFFVHGMVAGSSWSLHVREPRFRNHGNLEAWALESGIQRKESGISLTIRIWNPSSTVKVPNPVPGIRNPQLGIHNSRLFSIPLDGAKLVWYYAWFVDIC